MGLDQFYTKPEVVDRVLSLINCSLFDYVVEPSAGAGDFLRRLPKDTRVGIDLEPADPEIEQGDFFDFKPATTKNVLTIGNPPFGKNSSLAVKFFNHAASFSDCIAFIVPRTFRKPSIINRLHQNFHLIEELSRRCLGHAFQPISKTAQTAEQQVSPAQKAGPEEPLLRDTNYAP